MSEVILYDYWRSSASYRVRIALNLLGIEYETRPVNLLERGHQTPDYLALNPQGLVPTLLIDGKTLTQSLAIIEYLHATRHGPTLLPACPTALQRVRQLSYAIAMETHPICNLSVAAHAAQMAGGGNTEKENWMRHFIGQGLTNFEALLDQRPASDFCFGETPTMADCCLVPQLYNARRWQVDLEHFPRLLSIGMRAEELDAFKQAYPRASEALP